MAADGGREEPGRDGAGRDEGLDDAFARIVADWDREPEAGDTARWPAQEDVDPDASDDPSRHPPDASARGDADAANDGDQGGDHGGDGARTAGFTLSLGPAGGRAPGPRTGPVPWDDEGHYVPPPPPPLPRPTGARGAAWVALVAGPLLLLLATVLGREPPDLLTAACIIGFVGGLVFLIVDMDNGRGDGWDDGAQL